MNWALYIIQVNIYLVVFYGFYKVLLDKETYFTLNRIYLIVAGGLSLAIPFMRFEWFAKQAVTQPVYMGVTQLNQFVTEVTVAPESTEQFNMVTLFVSLYIIGVTVFVCRFVYRLYKVRLLLTGSRTGAAFSFFGKQVVDEQLPGAETISRHEEIHIRQLHSADVLFFEALGVLIWFNPIIYFYKLTIKRIHEYLADEEAARFQGDKDQYALLLMSNALGVSPGDLTNGFFNQKILKKRIFMLYKQRSRKVAILKYGLFVPLFSVALAASSASLSKNENILQISDEIQLDKQIAIVQDVVQKAAGIGMNPERKPIAPSAVEPATRDLETIEDWAPFYKFVSRLIRYPVSARTANIQGTSLIKFTLKSGEILDVSVVSRLGSGCDTEVLRTVLAYGDYDSIKDGKYLLPVAFSLEGLTATVKPQTTAKPVGYTMLDKITVRGYSATAITGKTVELSEINVKADESGKVYDFVSLSQQPSFPGGMEKFYAYLYNSIQYPQEAKDNKVEGKVFLSFIVETDGALSDIKVDRRLGSGTDEEAVRVLKNSPRWVPGITDGQRVRVKYNIPISFSLVRRAEATAKTSTVDVTDLLKGKVNSIRIDASGNYDSPTTPLYVIDGVVQKPSKEPGVSPLSTLKGDDIASIEILKDETATKLYGIEGKNGVVIIVTKQKAKKP